MCVCVLCIYYVFIYTYIYKTLKQFAVNVRVYRLLNRHETCIIFYMVIF